MLVIVYFVGKNTMLDLQSPKAMLESINNALRHHLDDTSTKVELHNYFFEFKLNSVKSDLFYEGVYYFYNPETGNILFEFISSFKTPFRSFFLYLVASTI
ncbi:MAG: hypothetical protein ACRCXZ_01520 [Patescibacteria group bacterium]